MLASGHCLARRLGGQSMVQHCNILQLMCDNTQGQHDQAAYPPADQSIEAKARTTKFTLPYLA